MVRSEMIGTISAAPISTAFCTMRSMFFPFGIAWPSVMRQRSGGVAASCNLRSAISRAPSEVISAVISRPWPLKRTALSPGCEAQDVARVVRLGAGQAEGVGVPVVRRDVEAVHREEGANVERPTSNVQRRTQRRERD